MVKQPHIALFQPHESIAPVIGQLFAKNIAFTYEQIDSIPELLELQKNNISNFDVIIVPSHLHDRSSAVTVCIHLKSEALLAATPAIVLSSIKDISAISTFYGSGADVVLTLPLDVKFLNLQVLALQRLSRSLIEEQQHIERDKGLRQAIISALHFVEEALVIFDPNGNVVFSNQAAKQLLNLYDDLQSTNIQKAYNLLQNICLKAMDQIAKTNLSVINHKNISLVKNTGENLKADMRITALKGLNEDPVAYCLSIVDITAPGELTNTLLQAERAQFMSLLLAAACMQLLNTNSLGSPVNHLSKIEQIFSRENPVSSLNNVATSFLEFIDNIANPTQMIRINIPENTNIAIKPSHLFLLLGNLILYCMKSSYSKSETIVSFHPSSNAFFGTLRVICKNTRDVDQSKEVTASSAIRTEFLALSGNKTAGFTTSIDHAGKIAGIYKLQILEKSNENIIELEIELPLAV
jgi:DNA-binding response OmpR family regulator